MTLTPTSTSYSNLIKKNGGLKKKSLRCAEAFSEGTLINRLQRPRFVTLTFFPPSESLQTQNFFLRVFCGFLITRQAAFLL